MWSATQHVLKKVVLTEKTVAEEVMAHVGCLTLQQWLPEGWREAVPAVQATPPSLEEILTSAMQRSETAQSEAPRSQTPPKSKPSPQSEVGVRENLGSEEEQESLPPETAKEPDRKRRPRERRS